MSCDCEVCRREPPSTQVDRLSRENQELRDKVAELEAVVRKLKQLVDAWI
jgi:predicted RNase H-like nuclease (RuvC/YqgF family)